MRLKLFILFFHVSLGFGQELSDTTYDKLYRNSFCTGVHFNTAGWGFYGELTKQKTYKYHHVVGFQATNIHHKNEFKITTITGTRSFFYYKLNSFVSLRPTIGGNLKLFEIKRDNGIEVQLKWKLGPSLGFLKPVYLQIRKSIGVFESPVERYDPEIHEYSVIEGRASWFKGIGESSFNIGVHHKLGFNFNFAKQKDGISGGEIGFQFDYFPANEIPIMFGADNYKLFTAFYLQFELGSKF